MHFSRRSHLDRRLNALSELRQRRQAQGRQALDLGLSNPTRAELPYDREAIASAMAEGAAEHTYEPAPFGLSTARAAVAAQLGRQGVEVDPARVVLTASTSEAYGLLFKLLCDPGDRVLVPAPSYPLLDHLAAFESVRPVAWPLRWEDGWWLDRAGLQEQIDPRTRAIVLVSPNNPTGSYTRLDDLRWLCSLGLPLISDEVFAPYRLRPDDRADRGGSPTSALALQGGLVFALGGLSKYLGLPQMKLSWMVLGGQDDLVQEALERLELLCDAGLSLATPVQRALPALLEAGRTTREAICARIARNRDALHRCLGPNSPATPLAAEGGWMAPVRLPATRDSEAWALHLLAAHDLLVHPGAWYGFARMEVVVLSLLVPPATFDEGLARLERGLQVT